MMKLKTPLAQAVLGIAAELGYISVILLAAYLLCLIWQFFK